MNMHSAALPPKYGYASEQDQKHRLFPDYQKYRSSMSALMVDSSDFSDWLACHNAQAARDHSASHNKYPEFLAWMRKERAGSRLCPVGNNFPDNFEYWLAGGRW